MKNNYGKTMAFLSALYLGVLITGALITSGCKTVTSTDASGATVTNRVPNIPLIQTTAKSIVFIGTRIYLNGLPPSLPAHPQDRPAFETARSATKALIAAGTFNDQQLAAALQSLPVSSLQGDDGALIVGATVILLDPLFNEVVSLDKARVFATEILPVAQGIAEGLDLALGPVQTQP